MVPIKAGNFGNVSIVMNLLGGVMQMEKRTVLVVNVDMWEPKVEGGEVGRKKEHGDERMDRKVKRKTSCFCVSPNFICVCVHMTFHA